MILLDAYALVAFLADEPAAEEVEELLRTGDCAIGVVNLAEAADVSARLHGLDPADVRGVVETLAAVTRLDVLEASATVAWRAAALRRDHYRKGTCEVSLADCFLLGAAGTADEVATADPAVATVAREEGFTVRALPDTSGRRP